MLRHSRVLTMHRLTQRSITVALLLVGTLTLSGATRTRGDAAPGNNSLVPVVTFSPVTGTRFSVASQRVYVSVCSSGSFVSVDAYLNNALATFVKSNPLTCTGGAAGLEGYVDVVLTSSTIGNTVSILACYASGCNREQDGTATYYFDAPPPIVNAPAPVTAVPGARTTLPFGVSLSASGVPGTYLFVPTCSPFTSCAVSPASAFISAPGSVPVEVSFVAAAAQPNTCVTLRASMGTATASACTLVTVGAAAVSRVDVIFPAPTITVNQQTQARASVTYVGGATDTNVTATWASGTLRVASVSPTGLVTGQEAGSSVITATVGGVSGTNTINVVAPSSVPLVSFSVPSGTRVSTSDLQVYITACSTGGVSTVNPYLNGVLVSAVPGFVASCPTGSSGQTIRVDLTLTAGANTLSAVACVTPGTNCNREQDALATYTYNPLSVTAAAAT